MPPVIRTGRSFKEALFRALNALPEDQKARLRVVFPRGEYALGWRGVGIPEVQLFLEGEVIAIGRAFGARVPDATWPEVDQLSERVFPLDNQPLESPRDAFLKNRPTGDALRMYLDRIPGPGTLTEAEEGALGKALVEGRAAARRLESVDGAPDERARWKKAVKGESERNESTYPGTSLSRRGASQKDCP